MPVGVREVARVAGVSAATVSRSLSRPGTVSEATRNKVLDAVRRVGYEPKAAVLRRTHTPTGNLAVIVPDLDNPAYTTILKSCHHRGRLRGYETFVGDAHRDPATETELVEELAPRVDGVIICSPRNSPEVLTDFANLTNLVLVDGACPGVPSVTVDYIGGMRQSVDHLVALGHRTIAYAGGRAPSWSEIQRRTGLAAAGEHHGLDSFVDLGGFGGGVAGGFAAADQLLATKATAVICINDYLALGLMNRLHKRGVDVPEHISIVGFDNAATTALVSPLLTTVVPTQDLTGWSAADLLTQLIDTRRRPESKITPVELTIRESTAEVRSS